MASGAKWGQSRTSSFIVHEGVSYGSSSPHINERESRLKQSSRVPRKRLNSESQGSKPIMGIMRREAESRLQAPGAA